MTLHLAFIIPFADIFIVATVILFALRGYRRGALLALLSILRVYFSFLITILFYERVALSLQRVFDIPDAPAQAICFIIIFIVSLTVIWVLMALIVRNTPPSPEGVQALSRVVGITSGLIEGILIVSIITMGISIYFAPSDVSSPFEGAISYRAIRQIAPAIRDFTINPIIRAHKSDAVSQNMETPAKSQISSLPVIFR